MAFDGFSSIWSPTHALAPATSSLPAPRKQKIDTSALKNIVEVDTEKGLVVAEPRLRMVELSHFLLSQGYSVCCVPELDDLTVGGPLG